MDGEPAFDLLAYTDNLGEPYELALAMDAVTCHPDHDDVPMSVEQAAYLNHLLRRTGRSCEGEPLTFAEAKARITELLDELG
jgi:hypothetical protein